jgi:hypothetical protein
VFDPHKGELVNKLGPLGSHSVRAKVYLGESRLDGRPAIVIDYSTTSLVARWVRDEIRLVSPGLYLGVALAKKTRLVHFVLRFPADTR